MTAVLQCEQQLRPVTVHFTARTRTAPRISSYKVWSVLS